MVAQRMLPNNLCSLHTIFHRASFCSMGSCDQMLSDTHYPMGNCTMDNCDLTRLAYCQGIFPDGQSRLRPGLLRYIVIVDNHDCILQRRHPLTNIHGITVTGTIPFRDPSWEATMATAWLQPSLHGHCWMKEVQKLSLWLFLWWSLMSGIWVPKGSEGKVLVIVFLKSPSVDNQVKGRYSHGCAVCSSRERCACTSFVRSLVR